MNTFTRLSFIFLLFFVQISIGLSQTVGTFHSGPGIGFEGITWMPNGTVYTVDFFAGSVYRIPPNGARQNVTTSFSFDNVAGGGHDGQGNYYFSDFTGNAIYKVGPSGGPQLFASTGFNGPVGIQLSADSAFLYVVNYNNSSVSKVSLATKAVTQLAIGGTLNGPDGVVLADNGDLIVANFNNNRLTRITPDGVQSLFATHNAGGNMGYIVKAGDYFYVPSITGNSLSRIDSMGNVVHITGLGTSGYTDGDASVAQFASPNGITANAAGDSLLITESGRIRFVTNLDAAFPVSIEEAVETSPLQLLSPPFSSSLRFSWPCEGNCRFAAEVVSLDGKVVYQQGFERSAPSYELHIPDMATGMYILRIVEQGDIKAVQKISLR